MRDSTKISDISSDEELKDVEVKLLKSGLLKLKKINQVGHKLGLKKKTILKNILLEAVDQDTVYVKNNRLQCYKNRNRSQGDLFRLMKYYCEDMTLKDFRQILFELINTNKVISFYCCNIKKIVNRPTYDFERIFDDEPTMRIRSDSLPKNWGSDHKDLMEPTWYGNNYREFKLKDELGLKAQIE